MSLMAEIKCPACVTVVMSDQLLEAHLPIKSCPRCKGVWLQSQHYWDWLEWQKANPESPPTANTSSPTDIATDTPPARRCPECGHFLTHAKVGHGLSFHIDRCGTCGGMWFNPGEWEALRAMNLHAQAHFIFSAAWQASVAREDRQAAHEEILRQKLGVADLDEIRRVKKWIEAHPHRSELYAYLQPDHPDVAV
jgi:Zn-finger nucleic acid-binding protein